MLEFIADKYLILFNYSLITSFVLLFLWETVFPWVKTSYSTPIRWWNTISLYLVGRYLSFWLLPIAVIPVAVYALENSLGLINLLNLPLAIEVLIGVFLYDLYAYLKHLVFHKVPFLWRLHRLHHSDPDVDIVTEIRHHPLESLVSSLAAIVAVLALGIHPAAIIIRALLSQSVSTMSHANIKLSERVDQIIRLLLVTPAMHRIHHSSSQAETDSNYTTLFSFWDRLFNTYVETPQGGYSEMQLGLKEFRSERDLWLDRMILQPFVTPPKAITPNAKVET